MDDEVAYIKLKCRECDCIYFPCEKMGKLWPPEYCGCCRKVSRDIADEYYFRTREQYPNILQSNRYTQEQITAAYLDLMDWLHENIYTAPIVKTLHRAKDYTT